MKKHISSALALVLFMLLGTSMAFSQSFSVSRYRWGKPWGKYQKGGFEIVIDREKGHVDINKPKAPESYTITGEHPFVYENSNNRKFGGSSFCAESPAGGRYEIHLRTRDDKVVQILVWGNGRVWCYDIVQ